MAKDLFSNKAFLLLLCLAVFLNALCLFNDIMEPDGTLYAYLAKQIVKSGDWLNLYLTGNDWLDKPHLPFWLAAGSFKVFGITSFAYKFSSFIFFIVSIFYCYKLSVAIYTKQIARLATLIFATSIHVIISNFDGKVEIYLTAFILGATYHLYKSAEKKWSAHIVAAALFGACAVMTKGIFSLIPISAGFIIFWLKTKQWQEFVNPKWYLLILLTFIFILPELYSLYTQFDLHPEKVIFGKTNVSGLRFFFWDSQFGRFANSGPIKGTGDPFFFLHTTLWAFLPWSILLLLAVLKIFTQKQTTAANKNRLIIGGSALATFLLFSFSKFQLPHYIVIIFPHFAMITASYIVEKASEKILKKISIFQTILFLLLIAMIVWLIVVYSFDNPTWFLVLLSLIVVITIFYNPGTTLQMILKKNIGFVLLLSIFLNSLFYPSLLQYQAGMMAGKWLNRNSFKQKVLLYKCEVSSLDFYFDGKVINATDAEDKIKNISSKDSLFVFSRLTNIRSIPADSIGVNILKTFPYFGISQLNIPFLDHQTRSSQLDTFALALLKGK